MFKSKEEAENNAVVKNNGLKHMVTNLNGGLIYMNELLLESFIDTLKKQQGSMDQLILNNMLTKNQDCF